MGTKKFVSHDMLATYLGNKNDIALRDEIVERSLPILETVANRVAFKKSRYLPPHVDEEDLYSQGLVELTPIIECFDPPAMECLDDKFNTHAYSRLVWRLMDYVRTARLMTRGEIDKGLRFKAAQNELRIELGNDPSLGEIAERLGIPHENIDSWHHAAQDTAVHTLSLSDEQFKRGDGGSVFRIDTIWDEPERHLPAFEDLLPSSLSRIERVIVTSVYRDNKVMREIGDAFGLSESRVSQIFQEVLVRIRTAYFENLKRKDAEE